MRIAAFGFVAGILWATLMGLLVDKFSTMPWALAALPAGALTGFIVTWLLERRLLASSFWKATGWAVASLPVGGFVFGVLFEVSRWIFACLGVAEAGFKIVWVAPLISGCLFAMLSLMSLYTVILLPCAIGTTLYLRYIVRRVRGGFAGAS